MTFNEENKVVYTEFMMGFEYYNNILGDNKKSNMQTTNMHMTQNMQKVKLHKYLTHSNSL